MIFDTAGRQEVDEALIDELRHLHAFLSPRKPCWRWTPPRVSRP